MQIKTHFPSSVFTVSQINLTCTETVLAQTKGVLCVLQHVGCCLFSKCFFTFEVQVSVDDSNCLAHTDCTEIEVLFVAHFTMKGSLCWRDCFCFLTQNNSVLLPPGRPQNGQFSKMHFSRVNGALFVMKNVYIRQILLDWTAFCSSCL